MNKNKYVWENIEDYNVEEIEEITNILDNLDLKIVKYVEEEKTNWQDYHISVLVKDKNSDIELWLDYCYDGYDIVMNWNMYIFDMTNSRDRIIQAIQSSYNEETETCECFEMFDDIAREYLENKELIGDNKFVKEVK